MKSRDYTISPKRGRSETGGAPKFREFLKETSSLLREINIKKNGIENFKRYFPKYTWDNSEFEIIYTVDKYKIFIFGKRKKESRTIIELDYSEEVALLYKKIQSEYKKIDTDIGIFLSEKNYFKFPIFIPAGRSFFATLQNNIFSFLTMKNFNIDPFILKFGSVYEIHKKSYNIIDLTDDAFDKEFNVKIKKIVESILSGKYKYKDEQDWIEVNGKDINISQASSGQQEALPMLVMLSALGAFPVQSKGYTFFIEEPEAHLFPVSQKNIISLIGNIYNKSLNNFVITTHSPYILTAFNNLIFGREVLQSKGIEKVKNIIEPDFLINYEDVSAYTINKGILENVKDDETKLIGASIIDSVSEELSETFNSLIEIDMSD